MPDYRGSTRRSRLPADWPARRDACRRRARGVCEWDRVLAELPALAAWWHRRRPSYVPSWHSGDEADHVHRGDDHSPGELAWLCRRHHASKSGWEGGTAGERRDRPAERHPGVLPAPPRR